MTRPGFAPQRAPGPMEWAQQERARERLSPLPSGRLIPSVAAPASLDSGRRQGAGPNNVPGPTRTMRGRPPRTAPVRTDTRDRAEGVADDRHRQARPRPGNPARSGTAAAPEVAAIPPLDRARDHAAPVPAGSD